MSSEEGFRILKNWERKKSALLFITVPLLDLASIEPLRVKSLGLKPPEVTLVNDFGDEWTLDLTDAEFREANPTEEPPPMEALSAKDFARFLFVRLRDGREVVFGERILLV